MTPPSIYFLPTLKALLPPLTQEPQARMTPVQERLTDPFTMTRYTPQVREHHSDYGLPRDGPSRTL